MTAADYTTRRAGCRVKISGDILLWSPPAFTGTVTAAPARGRSRHDCRAATAPA